MRAFGVLKDQKSRLFAEILPQHSPAMFIIVTMIAEVFPIGTVGGVVMMVPIAMMHRQQLDVGCIEFPPALGADRAVDFQ